MKSNTYLRILYALFGLSILLNFGCVTKKKKGEVSKLGKFYHNVTSEYNGYFNANELYNASVMTLTDNNNDNYSKILDVYDFVSVPDPKVVNPDLDKAIEKVIRVATIHEPGDWVDDCYVLMGKSQFIKQDYIKAEETFEYFEEEFNPANPYGKNFQKRKLSSKAKKAAAKDKKEEDNKIREEEKKKANKVKEEKAEKREEVKKEQKQTREEKQKQIKKDREQAKKDKEKATKERKKTGKKPTPKSKREIKTDSTQINKNKSNPSENKKKEEIIKEEVVEEEVPIAEDDKKKKKPKTNDKSAYNEGLLWLARTYTRTEQFSAADFLLRRLEKTDGLKDVVKEGLPVAQADLMIKQKSYDDALPYLDQAIKVADNKNHKARYAYIAGQIMQQNKNYAEAAKYYTIAKNKAKDFKLKFNSELALAKANALSGGKTNEQTIAQLEKFLKETKYADFKDQIYFSMGEVALEFDRKKAKEYFAASSGANIGNKSLKTEACYMLAELSLKDKEYTKAKLYYDTTLVDLPRQDDKYFYVKNMASNLTSIATNVIALERIDSLLVMGEMTQDELKAIAKKRKELELKNGTSEDKPKTSLKSGIINTSRGQANVSSTFFAYNSASVEAGKAGFKTKWGNRKLEDNWRRSNKASIENNEGNTVAENEAPKANEEMADAEFKRIMSDVPLNPFQKEALKGERKTALYQLGKDYRDKLKEYELSANTLELLLEKHPGIEQEAEVYYYLYLDYLDLNNQNMASKYKQLLASKYPENKYAKLANDPNFLDALNADAKKLDTYYDQTYDMFQKAQYPKVMNRVQTAIDAYGKDNKLVAKFSLLNAMSLGATQGKEAYIKALQEVTLRYPKTAEESKAKEILRFLGGDSDAFENIDIRDVDNIFTLDDNNRHYIAVIIQSFDANIFEQAKISISEFNKQYFSSLTLQLGEAALSKEEATQIILIRSFENKVNTMKYYESIVKSKEEFVNGVGYELLPITQNNYRKMLENKTHKKYKAFFDKHYLSK
jgi:tetratricopeptide (TPR) repeat protein